MTSTRQITKRQLDQIVAKLQEIEILAINIGLLYQNSDVPVSHVMLVLSEMVKVAEPLVQETNDNL